MSPRSAAPRTLEENFAFQRDACAAAGSDLYARILEGVRADIAAGGVSGEVLRPHADDPYGSALALRFLAALHRLVLQGRAPDLARFYPSVGGDATGDPVPAFLATVEARRPEVEVLLHDGVQTNEVGRAAALVGAFAAVARRTGLPLRVFEVGASAGLNLRWDHFWYATGTSSAGDADSPVRFTDVWEGAPPDLRGRIEVVDRRGCDRNPIDATTADGRLLLLSFLWPDQRERFTRLEAAIEVARRVPATVEREDAAVWVERLLAAPAPGTATVVYHSIVLQYLTTETRRGMRDALRAAGARATRDAPIHWLRMEPAGDRADLRLTSWRGEPDDGEDEVLGECGFHGRPVWWR